MLVLNVSRAIVRFLSVLHHRKWGGGLQGAGGGCDCVLSRAKRGDLSKRFLVLDLSVYIWSWGAYVGHNFRSSFRQWERRTKDQLQLKCELAVCQRRL